MEELEIYKTKFAEKFNKYNPKESIEDGSLKLEIINPSRNNIVVYFDEDEMTFFFSEFHMHICYEDDDFKYLTDTTEKILLSKYAAMIVYSEKRWLMSNLVEFEDVPINSLTKFLKFCFPGRKDFQNELRKGGKVCFFFWNSNKNMTYKIQDGKINNIKA